MQICLLFWQFNSASIGHFYYYLYLFFVYKPIFLRYPKKIITCQQCGKQMDTTLTHVDTKYNDAWSVSIYFH